MKLVRTLGFVVFVVIQGCGGGGGGGGSSTGPKLISSVTQTVQPSGGSLETPDGSAKLVVPAGALDRPTDIQIEVFEGSGDGNNKASDSVTHVTQVSMDVAGLEVDADLDLQLLAIAPMAVSDRGVGLTSTVAGVVPLDTTYDPVAKVFHVTQNKENFVSDGKSRAIGPRSKVVVKKPKESEEVPPRVELYKLLQVVRVGDPDSDIYKQDFNTNWNREVSPVLANKRIAIVVHGIFNDLSNLTEMALHLKRLRNAQGQLYYDEVYGVNVGWQARIRANGAAFASILATWSKNTTAIDIFGHSQGGLVARSAIEQSLPSSSFKGSIKRLFTFGTPHKGVPGKVTDALIQNVPVARYFPGVNDLNDTSEFLSGLNGSGASISTKYVTLAGDQHSTYKVYGVTVGPLTHFVLQEPMDGVVPVYSAAGLGVGHGQSTTFLFVYPLNHSSIRGLLYPGPGVPLNLDVVGADKLSEYILDGEPGVEGFDITNFNGLSTINMGAASVQNGTLQLSPAVAWQAGASWYPFKQLVQDGFSTDFSFRMDAVGGGGDTPGADGFAFVIQNQGFSALGTTAQGIGYAGITNSLAIEFDTYRNADYFDPNANHVAVQTRGLNPNSSSHSSTLGLANPGVQLNNGAVHQCRVTYSGGTLRVYVGNMSQPVLTTSVNLSQTLGLDQGRCIVGFTGATGTSFERIQILSWKYSH